jgi:hypothetical protein
MKRSSLLLPFFFRLPGFILVAAGSVFGIMRFWFDIKPGFLHMKVYAIYSEYLGEKYFHFIRDNMSEELVGVLLVMGAWMVALSRDRFETDEKAAARSKAFFISAYIQIAFLLFSLLFMFGIAFLRMLMVYMVLPPAVYFIVYRILSSGSKSSPKSPEQL